MYKIKLCTIKYLTECILTCYMVLKIKLILLYVFAYNVCHSFIYALELWGVEIEKWKSMSKPSNLTDIQVRSRLHYDVKVYT